MLAQIAWKENNKDDRKNITSRKLLCHYVSLGWIIGRKLEYISEKLGSSTEIIEGNRSGEKEHFLLYTNPFFFLFSLMK